RCSKQIRACTDSLICTEARAAGSPARHPTATEETKRHLAPSPIPPGREPRRESEYPDLPLGHPVGLQPVSSSSLQHTNPFAEQRLDPRAEGADGAVRLIFGQAEARQRSIPWQGR